MKRFNWGRKLLAAALSLALAFCGAAPAGAIVGLPTEEGQLFTVFPEEIEGITVTNGSTGKAVYLDEKEDLTAAAEILTGFRYTSKEELPEKLNPGYEYFVQVDFLKFEDLTPMNLYVTGGTLIVTDEPPYDGVYTGKAGQLEGLKKLVDNAPQPLFPDLDTRSRSYPAIQYAAEHGFMQGIAGEFRPDENMTRAMAAAVLYRLAGSPETDGNKFSDVREGAWYAKAVNWAAKEKIVHGMGDGRFCPDRLVTREQFAAMAFRYAMCFMGVVSNDIALDKEDLSRYKDGGDVAPYAKMSLGYVVSSEWLPSDLYEAEPVSLRPKDPVPRRDAAGLLREMDMFSEIPDVIGG